MTWRARGRDREVAPEALSKLEAVQFKARGDLLNFAARHPGALSGYFLAMVHQKCSHGRLRRSKQLGEVSVGAWARAYSSLTETRDEREAQTLSEVMDLINARDLATAMDVLALRIIAIQTAKGKAGSWERAQNLELVGGTGSIGAGTGMLRLTA